MGRSRTDAFFAVARFIREFLPPDQSANLIDFLQKLQSASGTVTLFVVLVLIVYMAPFVGFDGAAADLDLSHEEMSTVARRGSSSAARAVTGAYSILHAGLNDGDWAWVTSHHGRIKVRFHWDRLSPEDGTASCWIRVAQTWAGAGWGSMFIPRVGMEVVVEFLVEHLLVDGLLGEAGGLVVPLDDGRRVDVLVEQVLGAREQFARQHRRSRRAVADLLLLRGGDLDDHLGGGVLDVHLLQDGRAVVRDDDVSGVGHQHLVHPARPECRSYRLRDGFPGADVGRLRVLPARAFAALCENEHRLAAEGL